MAENPTVSTGGKIFVVAPKLDQVAITTADSTAWSIRDNAGTVLTSGTLTYVSLLPVDGYDTQAGWFANVTWPSTPQTVHAHMTITKSSVVRNWHQYVTIAAFM